MSVGCGPNVGFPDFAGLGLEAEFHLDLGMSGTPSAESQPPVGVFRPIFAAFTFPVQPRDSPDGALGLLLLLSGW